MMLAIADMLVLSDSPSVYATDWAGGIRAVAVLSPDRPGTIFQVKLFCPLFKEGEYGFHVHELGTLAPAKNKQGNLVRGMGSKDHYDPGRTKSHQGPYGQGHEGDLPRLYFTSSGLCIQTVAAPRVSLNSILGRTLIIHGGYDNYSDTPEVNGGSGGRVLGGVLQLRQIF